MRVAIKRLRRQGRRITEYGTLAGKRIEGDLILHTQVDDAGAGAYGVATFKNGAPKDPDVLPPLYEPVLVAIGNTGFLLRGFESLDGAS